MTSKAVNAPDPTPLWLLVDRELQHLIGQEGVVDPELWERALALPAREFLSRQGKRVRGRLVEAAWGMAGGEGDPPTQLSLAIEVLHAGSLIVDDIEDGSAERRGAPTLHRVFGLPTALNTGNWFYFLGLELIGRLELSETELLAAHRRAVRASLRCHHGQALDLSSRVTELSKRDVPCVVATVTSLKTGSLTELAATLGALAAGAPGHRVQALARLGREIGVALQMLDDLAGVVSASRRDKGHEDLRLLRPTWPWAWLAEQAEERTFGAVQALAERVHAGQPPAPLARRLAEAVAERGRFAARARARPALEELREEIGASAHLEAVEREIQRLEDGLA
jgi:geranylgeranyl pyrophosphate synthase